MICLRDRNTDNWLTNLVKYGLNTSAGSGVMQVRYEPWTTRFMSEHLTTTPVFYHFYFNRLTVSFYPHGFINHQVSNQDGISAFAHFETLA